MVKKRWLAVFIVTYARGLAAMLDLFRLHVYIVLFFAFVPYQQNIRLKVFGGLCICGHAGGIDNYKI